MKFEFHPAAEEEFIEAAVFYESRIPELGMKFGAEVRRAIDHLLAQLELGSRFDSQMRKLVLTGFPFSLIYTVRGERLQIVAVAHATRRPGYWRSRVKR